MRYGWKKLLPAWEWSRSYSPFTKWAGRAVQGCSILNIFRYDWVPTQQRYRKYESQDQQSQQTNSIIGARKRLAPSVDGAPCLARVPSSRLITSIRRIYAIKPITRNGSVTSTCERMEILTVCRISTSIKATSNSSNTRRVWAAIEA